MGDLATAVDNHSKALGLKNGIAGEANSLAKTIQSQSFEEKLNKAANSMVKLGKKYGYGEPVEEALKTGFKGIETGKKAFETAKLEANRAPQSLKKQFGKMTLGGVFKAVAQKAAETMPEYVEDEGAREQLYDMILGVRSEAVKQGQKNNMIDDKIDRVVQKGQHMLANQIRRNKQKINVAAKAAKKERQYLWNCRIS